MSSMEYCKEWQRTLGEGWSENRKKKQKFKRNKKKIKTNRRRNDSHLKKGRFAPLTEQWPYLNSEPQKDAYIENVNPESQ